MNLPFADNRAEEANMQLVAGGGINDGVMETPNNYSVPTECTVIRSRISTPQIIALVAAITNHQASSKRRRGGRIRKKHLSEEELIERKRHVNMLNTDRKGKPTSFNVCKWKREKAASASIVHHIEVNNFKKMKNKKKKKKTPTHIYFD
ncbi:hypothetical protein IGI04_003163 [Brassica rapa subsp. trilocularis]|uniref:Uncharacterized protein n=1 Tax=Brassica rapa subsp. trilocularis TaxID=1813537 RepID=A0ABQ7NZL9_BRACM|nr:hypothetical protein IGI04_003163 [Brassica rapa subsp. trilocularis]